MPEHDLTVSSQSKRARLSVTLSQEQIGKIVLACHICNTLRSHTSCIKSQFVSLSSLAMLVQLVHRVMLAEAKKTSRETPKLQRGVTLQELVTRY
eukprot:3391539-Amphidinium_carterae.1